MVVGSGAGLRLNWTVDEGAGLGVNWLFDLGGVVWCSSMVVGCEGLSLELTGCWMWEQKLMNARSRYKATAQIGEPWHK